MPAQVDEVRPAGTFASTVRRAVPTMPTVVAVASAVQVVKISFDTCEVSVVVIALALIARSAENLEVRDVVGTSLRSRDDVVNLKGCIVRPVAAQETLPVSLQDLVAERLRHRIELHHPAPDPIASSRDELSDSLVATCDDLHPVHETQRSQVQQNDGLVRMDDAVPLQDFQWHLPDASLVEADLALIGRGKGASELIERCDTACLDECLDEQRLVHMAHLHLGVDERDDLVFCHDVSVCCSATWRQSRLKLNPGATGSSSAGVELPHPCGSSVVGHHPGADEKENYPDDPVATEETDHTCCRNTESDEPHAPPPTRT